MADNTIPSAILEYIDFQNAVDISESPFVTKERVDKNAEKINKCMNHLLMYPDIFLDIITPKDNSFKLFFEQRIVMRAMQRYRQCFFTFTRAFSKSFCAFYTRYQRCMFVPNHKAFAVGGSKKQAAQIAREKVIDDLWGKFPLLANEMQKIHLPGEKVKTPFKENGDQVEFSFTNGSRFDVVGGKMRGGRRNSGIFEEIIEQDPTYVNETIIPLLNSPRVTCKGRINPYEPQSSKIFITTAGYCGTFAYDKLVETFCYSLLQPDKYIVIGGSYKIPVMHGRLSAETMKEILSSPSFASDSVDREYISTWSTSMVGAAFQANKIADMRKIKRAEYKPVRTMNPDKDFYFVAADIAKDGAANTAVIVGRVTAGDFYFNYRMVNLFTIDTSDFEVVANILKQTAMLYEARMLIYDANGVGAGLREWLNKDTKSSDGLTVPGLGIINPPSNSPVLIYKEKYRNICYEIKSGGAKASEIHFTLFRKMGSGKIRFLAKTKDALENFSKYDSFAKLSTKKKETLLRPYRYTDQLEVELKNLDIVDNSDRQSQLIMIERRNNKIQKDFFSSLEYGIYGVQEYLEQDYYSKLRKKMRSTSRMNFVSSSKAKTKGNNRREKPVRTVRKNGDYR